MKRRVFCFLVAAAACAPAFAANRRFVFRIKTKSGGIIGNIVIHADNMDAAKYKLRQRYPDCEILDAKEE